MARHLPRCWVAVQVPLVLMACLAALACSYCACHAATAKFTWSSAQPGTAGDCLASANMAAATNKGVW